MGRCGVLPGAEVLDLARCIVDRPGLRFEGLMGFEGHAVMISGGQCRTARNCCSIRMVNRLQLLDERASGSDGTRGCSRG
jgi:D-serine deaminase-like pyridoxal phosphate-dependent protein